MGRTKKYMGTQESFKKVVDRVICDNQETYEKYVRRSEEGALTRDENAQSHICVYFLPIDSESRKVFMILHKKAGMWLSPGGHVDAGETLLQALNREMGEELGTKNASSVDQKPFLLTMTPIDNIVQPCKLHFDVWFAVHTDGKDFAVDPTEFLDAKWLSIAEAMERVVDPANLRALRIIGQSWSAQSEKD